MLLALLACWSEPLDSGDFAPIQDKDGDGVIAEYDCSDENPYVGLPDVYWIDRDGDGYGTGDSFESCAPLVDTAREGGDCDDDDPDINPGQSDSPCNGVDEDCNGVIDAGMTVGTHFETLEEALAAASPGDEICLPAGDYQGPFTLGGGVILSGAGQDKTSLLGDGSGPVVTTDGDLTLTRLALKNGAGLSAAVDPLPGSTLRLSGVEIRDMALDPDSEQHLLRPQGGQLELLQVAIMNLSYDTSGSIDGLVVSLQDDASLLIQDLTMADLSVRGGSGQGVLVHGEGAQDQRLGEIMLDRWALESAGDLSLVSLGAGTLSLNTLELSYSEILAEGSLILVDHRGLLEGEELGVGAVALEADSVQVVRAAQYAFSELRMKANTVQAQSLCLVEVEEGEQQLYRVSYIANQLVAPSGSGALLCADEATLSVDNFVLSANHGAFDALGPWILATGGSMRLSQGDLTANVQEGDSGRDYAMIGSVGAAVTVHNTSVVRNEAVAYRQLLGAAAFKELGERAELEWLYSNSFANSGTDWDFGLGTAELSELPDTYSSDPSYVSTNNPDPLYWNLNMDAGSPLEDAGDPDVLDRDGSRSDVGAFGGPYGGWWP